MKLRERIDAAMAALARDPANLGLARDAWALLRELDGRSWPECVRIFGAAAIADDAGCVELAKAMRELFEESGELPREAGTTRELLAALEKCAHVSPDLDWLRRAMALSG